MSPAERIFAANFPGLYYGKQVTFPKPAEAEPPRGKLAPTPYENGPTLSQPGIRLSPDVIRLRRETELSRKRDHLCLTCGDPAKFYPERKFNQWGRLCPFHADLAAAETRARTTPETDQKEA